MAKICSSVDSRLRSRVGVSSLALALAWACVPTLAFAQEQNDTEAADAADVRQIVVTGTLVRGIAPPGADVIDVNREAIQATGAVSTPQLLQTIPQINSFNDLLAPGGFGNRLPVNRPSLRGLDSNTAGGTTTLSLLDGHRIVGAGIISTGVDPAIIPPGALERVDVMPDGGSAIYGSDAVAGVINYITRKKVEGVEVDARYGLGDDYTQWDFNVAAGQSWSTGSAYIAYSRSEHDAIFGRDRDYVRQYPTTQSFAAIPGLPTPPTVARGLECSPGNRVELTPLGGYPVSQGQLGAVTDCDYSDDLAFYPSEKRNSVFGSVFQEFGSGISLDVRGFYSDNKTELPGGSPFRANKYLWPDLLGPAPAANFINSPYIFSNFTLSPAQQVFFAWGRNTGQQVKMESYGILPTLSAELGGNWQLRVMGSQSWSRTESHENSITTMQALDNAIISGLFNPYDPSASDPTALAVIASGESFGLAHQELSDIRLVADGDLFTMPGGAVKLAVGAEWYRESLKVRKGDTVKGMETGFEDIYVPNTLTPDPTDQVLLEPGRDLPRIGLHRNVKAVFGEVVVPLFGEDNRTGGLYDLILSAAGRYDDYSDVGDTFNPKFGLTYRPVEWFTVRGTWGTSFNAPSLADDPRAEPQIYAAISDINTINFLTPLALQPTVNGRSIAVVQGNSQLVPQEATTYTIGADMDVPFAPGLRLSATYYNIAFKRQIGLPPLTEPTLMWGPLGDLVYVADQGEVTQELIDDFIAGSQAAAGNCLEASCTFAIMDIRKRNLGKVKLDGLDFGATYATATNFGSINLGANATYELNRKLVLAPGLPAADLQDSVDQASAFRLRANVGATVGNLTGQFIWSHRSGFDLATPVSVGLPDEQHKVDAFDVFDLFFRYDFTPGGAGHSLMKKLAFTLSINNIFDTDPPEYRTFNAFEPAQAGFTNGSTVGRLVQFGISAGF